MVSLRFGATYWRAGGSRSAKNTPARDAAASTGSWCYSLLRVKREGSERRASVRDFHSLRVTWVTLALTAGVPLELVQKVTGHKTTDIVLKHYYQPGREDFRKTLQSAMPRLLTNGHKTPKEEMRELIDAVKPKALRERLLKVWAKW